MGVKVDVLEGRRVYLPKIEINRRHPSSAVFSLDTRTEAHHEVPRVRRTAASMLVAATVALVRCFDLNTAASGVADAMSQDKVR